MWVLHQDSLSPALSFLSKSLNFTSFENANHNSPIFNLQPLNWNHIICHRIETASLIPSPNDTSKKSTTKSFLNNSLCSRHPIIWITARSPSLSLSLHLLLPQSGIWSHPSILPKADFVTLKLTGQHYLFLKSDKYINKAHSSNANICPKRV